MGGVGGILLTGGASRRMGRDKASLPTGPTTAAVRLAALLGAVASPACEVGPHHTSLPVASEEQPGAGPLAAIVAGFTHLSALGHDGPALVVACDLALLDLPAMTWLAGHPDTRSVVPLVSGRPQWLCARWSAADLAHAVSLVEQGERTVQRVFIDRNPCLVGPEGWPPGFTDGLFTDADTPRELRDLLGPPADSEGVVES